MGLIIEAALVIAVSAAFAVTLWRSPARTEQEWHELRAVKWAERRLAARGVWARPLIQTEGYEGRHRGD